MSKDIKEFTPHIIGPFTRRQVICIAIACAYGIPVIMLLPIGDLTIRFMLGVVIMAPVVACGWVRPYNMPLEIFLAQVLKEMLLIPRKRKYVAEDVYIVPEENDESKGKKLIITPWDKLPGKL